MNKLILLTVSFILFGCSTQDDKNFKEQLDRVLNENPEIITNYIEKNSIKFMNAALIASKAHNLDAIRKRNSEMETELANAISNPAKVTFEDIRRIYGPPEAPIEVISYDNPTHPQSRWFNSLRNQMIKKYPGKVKISQKYFIGKENEELGIMTSLYFEAIKQKLPEKAWEFINTVYGNQQFLLDKKGDFLDKLMGDLKINVPEIKDYSKKLSFFIEADKKVAQSLNKGELPFMIVNGVVINMPQKLEYVEKIIEQLKAKKLVTL